jgi:AcrR family transcriptional regulator
VTSDDRRQTILDCAARLFGHYGASKTTVADIAREAQMGVGTVYLVFTSKEAIVEELSSSAHGRVLEAMRDIALRRAGESLSMRLAGVLEVRVRMFQRLAEQGQHARELVHCASGPVCGVHAKFQQDERQLIEALLEDAAMRGELASLAGARTAELVQRAWMTLSPPWLYDQPVGQARRAARELVELRLSGILRREEKPLARKR